ncbi:integrase core domain protein, partial [Vibrio cholerae HC-59A1]
MSPINL